MVDNKKYTHLSEFEKRILLILEQKLCSISHISRELNENREFLRGVLESLRHRDVLTRTTVGKSTVYLIKDLQYNFSILDNVNDKKIDLPKEYDKQKK